MFRESGGDWGEDVLCGDGQGADGRAFLTKDLAFHGTAIPAASQTPDPYPSGPSAAPQDLRLCPVVRGRNPGEKRTEITRHVDDTQDPALRMLGIVDQQVVEPSYRPEPKPAGQ